MTTETTKPEQGLEKTVTKTPDVITTPEEFKASMALWAQKNYHVLTPFANLSGLAPQHGIMVSVVKLDPNPDLGEIYAAGKVPWLEKGEVAIAKVGLRKLAECAGISYSTTRTDDRRIPNYWEFKAIVSYRGVDGSVITREATKEWDLRDGSPQLKGWTGNQVSEGRKHGLRNCEARAINAAIREAGCGIRQKYKAEELAKPFVVLRVAFRADMSDPDQKRMVLERALGSTAQLYPRAADAVQAPRPADAEAEGESFTAAEPRSVGRGSTAPPAADQPPSPGAVKIVDVSQPIKGKNEQTGREWTMWSITDSTGRKGSTFSQTTRDRAQAFRDAGDWVDVGFEEQGQYTNVKSIEKAGTQPALPIDGDL